MIYKKCFFTIKIEIIVYILIIKKYIINNMYLFILLFVNFVNSELINIQSLSVARSQIGSASLSNQGLAIFAGGSSSSGISNNVDIYNINTNSWSLISLTNVAYNLASTSLENIGIAYFGYLNTFYIYNGNTNTLSKYYYPEQTCYASASATSLPNQGLVFFTSVQYQSCSIMYNHNTDTWSQLTVPGQNNNWLVTSLHNYGIVIYTGDNMYPKGYYFYYAKNNSWYIQNPSFSYSSSTAITLQNAGISFFVAYMSEFIVAYNASSNTWYQIQGPLITNYLISTTTLEEQNLVFFTGGSTSYITNNNIYTVCIYNVIDNSWTYSRLFQPRLYMSAVSLQNYGLVLFAGGSFGVNSYSNVDAFSYCTNGTYLEINIVTRKTYCTPCPEGYYCPNYSVEPIICIQGHYCTTKLFTPMPCPPGTTSDIIGATNNSVCKLCPSGTYNTMTGQNSSACIDCYPGFNCFEGSVIPTPCPENYYCPNSITSIPCPPGTYYPGTLATSRDSCIPCTLGNECIGYGNFPITCKPGTYSNKGGAVKCIECPAGYTCELGTIEPQICLTGTISLKGSASCKQCGIGEYTEGAGQSICYVCPSTKFSINGWWCMTLYQRLVFVLVWISSIFSSIMTFIKIRTFIKNRIRKMKNYGIKITFRNFVFIKSKLKKMIVINDLESNLKEKNYSEQKIKIIELNKIIENIKKKLHEQK